MNLILTCRDCCSIKLLFLNTSIARWVWVSTIGKGKNRHFYLARTPSSNEGGAAPLIAPAWESSKFSTEADKRSRHLSTSCRASLATPSAVFSLTLSISCSPATLTNSKATALETYEWMYEQYIFHFHNNNICQYEWSYVHRWMGTCMSTRMGEWLSTFTDRRMMWHCNMGNFELWRLLTRCNVRL